MSAGSNRSQDSCSDADMSSDADALGLDEFARSSDNRGGSRVSNTGMRLRKPGMMQLKKKIKKKERKMSVRVGGVSKTSHVKLANLLAASVASVIKGCDTVPHAAAATAGAVAPADGRRSKRRSAAADIVAEMKSVTDRRFTFSIPKT
uniref:Uncharacterized protein n=1 Tax=Glossina palpalis gambiensis TaxID=67801 RepID=A0A1B0BA12_9MUSC